MAALSTAVVTDVDALAALAEPWDALAIENRQPLSAPSWLLSWWRNMAPERAVLHTVTVHDGERLVGIAPYFTQLRQGLRVHRPLGAEMAVRATPLAQPGLEKPVAQAIAQALAESSPRPLALDFERIDVSSAWPGLIAASWPGSTPPRSITRATGPAPMLQLEGSSYEKWLSSKSRKLRGHIRREARKLAEGGAKTSLASTPAELESALAAFTRMQRDRWGNSSPLATAEGARMMLDAGLELLAAERFRAWTITMGDTTITVQLFVAAGPEVAYWNGGWNPAFASSSPAILGICAAIEDSFARGERRMDFGSGDHSYKLRLADRDEPITSVRLYPPGRGRLRARFLLDLPEQARPLIARLRARNLPGSRGPAQARETHRPQDESA